MDNQLAVFEGKHEVMVLFPSDVKFTFKGDFLIRAKDVASALEYDPTNGTKHVIKFCKDDQVFLVKNSDLSISPNQTNRKLHNTGEQFITNLGLNRVFGKSEKPKAELFQDWLYEKVIPSNLEFTAQIDDYEYLRWTRRWRKGHDFEFTINRHKNHVDHLKPGSYIAILRGGKYRIGQIQYKEISLGQDGKASETWKIAGRDIGGILGMRLERVADAIEEVYSKLSANKRKLIKLKYWTHPQTLTWEGIAREIPVHRATAMRWRDEIVIDIAKKLGWA